MCGRYTLAQSAQRLADAFQLAAVPDSLPARYNIAPTQDIPVILSTAEHPQRQLRTLYWGLIPSWSKDPKIGARMINARAETLVEKPSFRTAFKRRRCLVLADGFYEWQKSAEGKQPYYFFIGDADRPQERQPFAFAGLWEHWESSEGDRIQSCTIITTQANDLLSTVHDRMPVILHPNDYDRWLDPTLQKTEALQPLLRPHESDVMGSYAVSSRVNSPRSDDPDCIQPLTP